MTLQIDPSYIANLSQILSRAKLDLSPIELAEILWLAVQFDSDRSKQCREIVVTEETLEQSEEIEPLSQIESPLEFEPIPQIKATANTESTLSEIQPQPQSYVNVDIMAELPPKQEAETIEQTTTPLPAKIPEAVALRNRREIAKMLRPLMRKVASRMRQEIDEEATAIRIAEDKIWNPVVKPEPERWLELAIVIEVTNIFDVWKDSIAEFQHLMERHGAFRNVRTWRLQTPDNSEPQLFLQTATGLNRKPRNPKELLDVGGRRLVLFLSDCTSKAWRSGQIFQLLELWSRQNPVTIAQLLPERYWDRSALGSGYLVALRSQLPGARSRDWKVLGLSLRRRQRLQGGLKFPVVTIQPHSLGEWARAMAAIGEKQTVGIVLKPDAFQAHLVAESGAEPLTAKQLVQQFRGTASEKAQELADRMAVLPVNWSVLRLLQKNLMQGIEDPAEGTGALYLAEIFLSGLLSPVENHAQKLKSTQQYNFAEGVRSVLLGGIPISEGREVGEEIATAIFKQLPTDVQERVNADIARRWGESLSYFEAFLLPDLPWGEDYVAEMLPFGQVNAEVLRRWGGDYAVLAERLEQLRGSQSSQVIDEEQQEFYYELLRGQFNNLEEKIGDYFTEHGSEFNFSLLPKEIDKLNDFDEVSLIEVVTVNITNILRLLNVDNYTVSFEVSAEIIFSVEFTDLDHDGYILGEILDGTSDPSMNRFIPNQSVVAIVNVDTILPTDDNREIEIELFNLTIEEPILISYQDAVSPESDELIDKDSEIDWQEIEFDVVTIEFSEYPPLEPFNFEVATQLRGEIRKSPGSAYQFVESLSDYIVLEMVQIPAGEFVMGAPKEEFGSKDSERPQHSVNMPEFYLGKYPITQEQWRFGASLSKIDREINPVPSDFNLKNLPVDRVSWLDAIEFCARLSQFTGREYRLPSETEWEYACRAGTTTPFYFGELITAKLANYHEDYAFSQNIPEKLASRNIPMDLDEDPFAGLSEFHPKNTRKEMLTAMYGKTTSVGTFPPNVFGLYDLHGNVWEWCLDHYHENYEGAPNDWNAWIDPSDNNTHRILRGGAWLLNSHHCRCANRHHDSSDIRSSLIGFRVACGTRND